MEPKRNNELVGTFDCSIIIPAYNRSEWLIEAILSCLDEQPLRREVIVVDDGSPVALWPPLADALAQRGAAVPTEASDDGVCVTIGTDRVRYFRRDNRGAPAARNFGLSRARGDYVKFLDDDDQLLPGVLAREVARARETGADVVVSGWLNRTFRDVGRSEIIDEQVIAPPPMQRGIDDMLESRAPWTSAALYRRAAVADLRWDEACGKAQEWMWAWTVCLSGVSYVDIDAPSAVYTHYPSQSRVSQAGDTMLRSTRWRQYILQRVEAMLTERNLLTPERRRRLIQYYYKDNRVLCESDPKAWRELCGRCRRLDPAFVPRDVHPLARILNRTLGYYVGARCFVGIRKKAKSLRSLVRR